MFVGVLVHRSKSFGVSNGVRQGGVLSLLLFNVYMDGLIEDFSESGFGCYWGHHFVGTFCYADDVFLLAPCSSALTCTLVVVMQALMAWCSMLLRHN